MRICKAFHQIKAPWGFFPGMGKDQLNKDAVECGRALGALGPDVSSVKLLGLSLSFSSYEMGIKTPFHRINKG